MGKEIGIDFGTTTTEVSYIDQKGYSRSMKIDEGKYIMPTVLYFKSEDEYIIGRRAEKSSYAYPEACVKNFKLHLTDFTKKYQVKAENGDEFIVKPIKAAQLFLNKLIQHIQPELLKKFGEEDGGIDKAVITVPAQFDPEEKFAIKHAIEKAAKLAGFSDIKVAAEPTAAAIAFQEENCEEGETVLVYDFGGGTFDVSVIQKRDNRYIEIATDGDKHLGGNLLTEKIAKVIWEHCLDVVERYYPFDEQEIDNYSEEEYELSWIHFYTNRQRVFEMAEEIKISFYEEEEIDTAIPFFYDDEKEEELISITMRLEEFYHIIKEDIEKTILLTSRVFEETMNDGRIDKIDKIVLAGGSSQIGLIQDLFEKDMKFKDLIGITGDSSTLISRGAARLATVELNVEEKTRFEIGTRVVKGKQTNIFERIIKQGETLPCSGKHQFYLCREEQREVTIEYYEKDIKNYPEASRIDDEGINLVSELTISGIPEISNPSVMVTFQIGADGTPSIYAEILDKNGKVVTSNQLEISKGGNLY